MRLVQQEDYASFGPWAWPNIIVCAIGLGLVVGASRGKWLRLLRGLKGAGLALLVMFISYFILGDPHLVPPLVPSLLTLFLSAGFFGSDLTPTLRKAVGWILGAAFLTYALDIFYGG
jgi:hypothetical protein